MSGKGVASSSAKSESERRPIDPYRTLTLVKPFDPASRILVDRSGGGRGPQEKERRPSMLGYAIAAAAGALLGLLIASAFGAGGSSARNEIPANPRSSVASLRASSLLRSDPEPSAPESGSIGIPSDAGINSSAEPDRSSSNPAQSVMRKVERKALVRPATRRDSGRESRTAPESQSVPVAHAQLPFGNTRYCSSVGETVFASSNRNADLDGIVGSVPRADAAMMRVAVSLSAEQPLEGHPFFISLGFENGGDYSVQIRRLEESTSGGQFRPIAGALVPATVAPGGLKELYRHRMSLSGQPYAKEFTVVDRNGDAWKAAVRLVPCEN